ncbi:hypothetical protein Tco_0229539 [Tanacetum coccineum]
MFFISLIHLLEAISAVKGNGVTIVKLSAGCVWRPKMTDLNNVSKDNSGSWVSKRGTRTLEKSDAVRKEFEAQCNRELLQGKATKASSTNSFNIVSTPVNATSAPRTSNDARPSFVPLGGSFPLNVNDLIDDPLMPDLEDTSKV